MIPTQGGRGVIPPQGERKGRETRNPRHTTRTARRVWWQSLTPQQQYEYRVRLMAIKHAHRIEEALDAEFRAIVC